MNNPEGRTSRGGANGFALGAVLVVVGALLILAVGALLVTGIERGTARSFVDRQRAELAARAALEEVRGVLGKEAANDDFLVLQSALAAPVTAGREPAPYLFIARGKAAASGHSFRYVPLFSSSSSPADGPLAAPEVEPLTGAAEVERVDFQALPYQDKVRAAWLPVRDAKGGTVARYAYWVEDLQGRVDAKTAGNTKGAGGSHARVKHPFPAAGLNDQPVSQNEPPLDQIALYAVDPAATDADQKSLGKAVVRNRELLVSPDSVLAAGGIQPPLARDAAGRLTDPAARAAEENLVAGVRVYQEQPLVPFSEEIDPAVAGKPKLNLNKLVATGGSAAVDEMADFIRKALPDFEGRRGGFPDDYLKTLAAGAIDYADKDGSATMGNGYRGVDSYPWLSEIVLHIDFLGTTKVGSRDVLAWRFRLFAELWNMSNQPITNGRARLSYEVNLEPTPIGSSADSQPFDDRNLLLDPSRCQHNLTEIGGKFYGPEITNISLLPDEYRFYEFATVNYTFDYTPKYNSKGVQTGEEIDLEEEELEARGITLRWNDQAVHRIEAIVRDAYGVSNFMTNQPRTAAKAAIPGHSYGPYGFEINNMGDPRISPYLRTGRVSENAYPENISPNRRNIRRKSIYDLDPSNEKRRHYGRVLPSEWPDGGHDSATGRFLVTTNNSIVPTDVVSWPPASIPAPLAANAPQRISNLGRYYSATELGRVYDPVLWQPAYTDISGSPGSGAADTVTLLRLNAGTSAPKPMMPASRNAWPEVTMASVSSTDYGGGNTLRIGRPEHGRFNRPGERAAQLLDLFHTGIPGSEDAAKREGNVIEINGNVNVNTAGGDALRAMAAGMLEQDPELCRVTSWTHDTTGPFGPRTSKTQLGAPAIAKLADQVSEAIVLRRPYASPSELAAVLNKDGKAVFGNKDLYPDPDRIKWTDAAAEEVFARVYDASTVRSRNFRIWVVGQAVAGSTANPEVLAEYRRAYTVFADPGERLADGTIDPTKAQLRIIHENDF